ncbi:transcriptional regulator with XRE-family HTH domain [Actinoalloteichus hoggarensis]|uniref:Transcriptional repressor DicA n=1 Tax=Actinoalloteichus hoggarensis TaxID=1470176 RepID=A0A221W6K4_9PSEU|nr:helix-turn-helix transcriptional regulator [Actinoalloteichus hoggarensis]ASO21303.1 transcriptional repressor DicA [Actinoalloteichus hoggarensis]MBB5921236.1 transcriptional regulator with XRE-family HTH domain [Actinoalloteichus hoggarensis]
MALRRQRFAQRRKAVGFSQEGLAERLGIDRSTVARWESGETEPLPWLRPKLTRALQVSIERLDELLAEAGESEALTDERLSYALEHPRSVDLVNVARLRDRVHDLDERYDRAPSTSLLADAGQCLGRVSFLRTHAATSRVRRELFAVEAEAATLMGQLVWDASQRRDHTTARAYLDQAVTAARQLRDPTAEGLALLRTSFVALYGEKNPDNGLTLAMQTAETTKTSSDALTGLAVLHAAEAWAMLGQRQDCERALGEAEGCFERIGAADGAADLFSPTQHGRLAGSCYLFLNDAKRAEPILEITAQALRDRSKSQAIVLGNLALARIRQQKLDEAVAALHSAIDVVEMTWGGGGLNIVFGAGRELRPWRQVPIVQDVYDRLLTLMTTA